MLHDKTLSLRRGQTIVVSEKEKVKESFLFFGFTKPEGQYFVFKMRKKVTQEWSLSWNNQHFGQRDMLKDS